MNQNFKINSKLLHFQKTFPVGSCDSSFNERISQLEVFFSKTKLNLESKL